MRCIDCNICLETEDYKIDKTATFCKGCFKYNKEYLNEVLNRQDDDDEETEI